MRVRTSATLLTVLMAMTSVLAHDGEPHNWNSPGALSAWDLAALSLLALSGVLYVRGTRRLRHRRAVHPLRERVAFAAGWTVLVVAILPPIDALAIQLFSIHMIQHELMMLIGAPLVIAGRPLSTCLWGVPDGWRPRIAAALQTKAVGSTWRWASAPLIAWALHGITIWVWHIPALYDAATGNEAIHAVQHAMFVSSAALFWWGLLGGRYGRAGYGAAVFYVFTTVVHTGLLGAIMTLSPVPLYPLYITRAAARGIDPLSDQELAGLLMWIPAGIILTVLGIALFAAWLGEAERRQRQIGRGRRPLPLTVHERLSDAPRER